MEQVNSLPQSVLCVLVLVEKPLASLLV